MVWSKTEVFVSPVWTTDVNSLRPNAPGQPWVKGLVRGNGARNALIESTPLLLNKVLDSPGPTVVARFLRIPFGTKKEAAGY
jgi:hypothetical protein